MTVELTMLAYTVAVFFVVMVIQANAGVMANGLPLMTGNRDNLPPDKVFLARTKRIVQNHIEGLAMFAPLVLIAAQANISNQWTVLGAQVFFYSRVAHALLYLLGLPWLRTIAFAVGLAGTILIFLALFGVLA
jgi:uncharacterized MAPEG superfamily protein